MSFINESEFLHLLLAWFLWILDRNWYTVTGADQWQSTHTLPRVKLNSLCNWNHEHGLSHSVDCLTGFMSFSSSTTCITLFAHLCWLWSTQEMEFCWQYQV